MNNIIEINLKIRVDMNKKTIAVAEAEILPTSELTYKEKTIAYFKKQVERLEQEFKNFETGINESELSEKFTTRKIIAETKYWQAKANLDILEAL